MKKLIKIIVLALASFSLTGCFSTLFLISKLNKKDNSSSDGTVSGSLIIKSKRNAKFYITETVNLPFTIYSLKGQSDVDYIEFQEAYNDIFVQVFSSTVMDVKNYSLQKESSKEEITFSNAYGSYVYNIVNNTLFLSNTTRNLFPLSYDENNFLVLTQGIDTNMVSYTPNSYSNANTIRFDFEHYNINVTEENTKVYMPVSTFVDIFLCPNSIQAAYNGKDLYFAGNFDNDVTGQTRTSTLEKKYYSESPWLNKTTRTQCLAEYTYNELCFALDHFYGLKEHRGMDSFDSYFSSHGLRSLLKDTKVKTFYEYFLGFVSHWLYDGHSSIFKFSPFQYPSNAGEIYMAGIEENNYYIKLNSAMTALTQLREEHGKSVGLTTYGNTAIISFDSFIKSDRNLQEQYQYMSYENLHNIDTYWMFWKAFEEIKNNSEITKIVIDVSLNGGGAVNAVPWLIAFLSYTPRLTIQNTLTGDICVTDYQVDLNRDYVFDEYDSYQNNYQFYLMTSEFSFSCGNIFPTIIKQDGLATIFGERSGGGSCAVAAFTTACGDIFTLSSTFQFGTYQDGYFQDNEDGIWSDYLFSKIDFYDDYSVYQFVNSI